MIDLLKGGAVGKRPSRQKSGREMAWAVLEVNGVQRAGMGSGISIKAEADNERHVRGLGDPGGICER